jgi:cytochrome c oxidase subunit I+III
MVYMQSVINGQAAAAVTVMAGFVVARLAVGKLDAVRRVSFDKCAILYHYAVGQVLFGLILIHGFPRVAQ